MRTPRLHLAALVGAAALGGARADPFRTDGQSIVVLRVGNGVTSIASANNFAGSLLEMDLVNGSVYQTLALPAPGVPAGGAAGCGFPGSTVSGAWADRRAGAHARVACVRCAGHGGDPSTPAALSQLAAHRLPPHTCPPPQRVSASWPATARRSSSRATRRPRRAPPTRRARARWCAWTRLARWTPARTSRARRARRSAPWPPSTAPATGCPRPTGTSTVRGAAGRSGMAWRVRS
jgi:hypothetical protein